MRSEEEETGRAAGADSSAEHLDELTGRAGVGAAWTILGYGGRQVIRLISNLILTRLLVPEHFGLMFMVTGVMIGIELFSDLGLGQAVIQNERDDQAFLNTAWTLSVGRGFLLWLVAFGLAAPLAGFFDEPALLDLLPVAALVALFDGFLSTKFFTANRELNLRRIITLEISAQLVGVCVMVAWALVSPTVWALVAGGVSVAIATTVLSHIALPGAVNRFAFQREAAAALASFGIWVFVSSALTWGADYIDRFLFRVYVDNATLGVYSVAVTLAAVPSMAMSRLAHSVVFPLYSRILATGEALGDRYRGVRHPMFVLGGWATAGLVAGGPTIIRMLYDDRYWDAGWMLQVISAGMWFGVVIAGSNVAAVLAMGRTHWTALISLARVVGIAALVPLGWSLGGFPGLVVGFASSELLRYGMSLWGALKVDLDGRFQDLKMTVVVVLSSTVGWAAVELLQMIGIENVYAHAVVIFIAVSACWAPWHLELLARRRRGQRIFSPSLRP